MSHPDESDAGSHRRTPPGHTPPPSCPRARDDGCNMVPSFAIALGNPRGGYRMSLLGSQERVSVASLLQVLLRINRFYVKDGVRTGAPRGHTASRPPAPP